ncbi:hypothetical protein BaRGS_00012402 [Batillaria attramentaria]|uniref:Uncharacterized protein n=1 Tax=Batillaria attramentaria TaxID=370345 RepID=A0ABD0LB63_9CAEN
MCVNDSFYIYHSKKQARYSGRSVNGVVAAAGDRWVFVCRSKSQRPYKSRRDHEFLPWWRSVMHNYGVSTEAVAMSKGCCSERPRTVVTDTFVQFCSSGNMSGGGHLKV